MLILKVYYHVIAEIKKIIYKIIYGKKIQFGRKTTFRKGLALMINKRAYVEIGENCFFNNYCSINSNESIMIGKNSIFGENVKIYDHNHIFNFKDRTIKTQGYKNGKIKIGENCWIGSNVIILKGTIIGNNCVIGAGCVIKGIIDDHTIVTNKNELNIKKIIYEE